MYVLLIACYLNKVNVKCDTFIFFVQIDKDNTAQQPHQQQDSQTVMIDEFCNDIEV